jgi:hypothetical protein
LTIKVFLYILWAMESRTFFEFGRGGNIKRALISFTNID